MISDGLAPIQMAGSATILVRSLIQPFRRLISSSAGWFPVFIAESDSLLPHFGKSHRCGVWGPVRSPQNGLVSHSWKGKDACATPLQATCLFSPVLHLWVW